MAEPQKVQSPTEEVLVWEGSPKWQADFGFFVLSALVSASGVAGLILLGFKSPWVWISLAAVLIGIVMAVGIRIKRRHERYRITNMTIEFQRGVFSTRIDNMELWRVNDIGFHQNLFDKILGVSKINLQTQDASHPQLALIGLPPGRMVYDRIKEGVHIARQARNVLGVTE